MPHQLVLAAVFIGLVLLVGVAAVMNRRANDPELQVKRQRERSQRARERRSRG